MKARLIAALALTLASASALADSRLDVQDVAQRAGLTTREVRMVLGAPTSFAEMRTSYDRSYAAVRRALGGEDPRALAKRYGVKDSERLASR